MIYPQAFISVHAGHTNNRLKTYKDNKIFLSKDSEFQIEFENYTNENWLAKIKFNGSWISDSGLVLKPGQHIYLDRYLDQSRRFKFDTYMVEDDEQVNRAISNNGLIEIYFYQQQIKFNNYYYVPQPIYFPNWPNCNDWAYTTSGITGSCVDYSSKSSGITNANYMQCCNSISNASQNFEPAVDKRQTKGLKSQKETGRVEMGANSNQTFSYENIDFNVFSSKYVSYKLLPASEIEKETNIRQYCPSCGYRLRDDKWEFCPRCGYRI